MSASHTSLPLPFTLDLFPSQSDKRQIVFSSSASQFSLHFTDPLSILLSVKMKSPQNDFYGRECFMIRYDYNFLQERIQCKYSLFQLPTGSLFKSYIFKCALYKAFVFKGKKKRTLGTNVNDWG